MFNRLRKDVPGASQRNQKHSMLFAPPEEGFGETWFPIYNWRAQRGRLSSGMNLWDDWRLLVLSDLEYSQRERFRGPSSGEKFPVWVQKIDLALDKMLFPVRLGDGEKPTARKVGEFLGQTYAYFGWAIDCMRQSRGALVDRFKKSVKEFLEDDYSADFESEMRTLADQALVFGLTKRREQVPFAARLRSDSRWYGYHKSQGTDNACADAILRERPLVNTGRRP